MTDDILSESLAHIFMLGTGCFTFASIYSIYIGCRTYRFLQSVNHFIIVYNNILINTIPCLMYFIKMLDYKHTIIGGYITDTYLNHFFIEWIFTTPLIISQFAVVSGLGLHRSLCLVALDIFMILCGYISYISKDYDTKTALFSVGCLNFAAIAAFVASTLWRTPLRGLKKTTYCVLSLWVVYPCTHLLYITHHIRLHSVVWTFSLLDILVKGIILNATVAAYYHPLICQQLPYA